MASERNVKDHVGNGLLIGAAFVAVPGLSSFASGHPGQGTGLLVIPVVLAAVGLSLKMKPAWIPLVAGGVVAALLIGITGLSLSASEEAVPGGPSPAPVKFATNPPTDAKPPPNETDWLPARDEIPVAAQSQYDDYITLFASYTAAQDKAAAEEAAYKKSVKDYTAIKKRYQHAQVSYSGVTHAYDQMQNQRDAWTTASAALTDLGVQVVEARYAVRKLFV